MARVEGDRALHRRGRRGSAPVAERLRALVRLRNDAARQIGFDNAYRAHLELGEMEQDWLYSTLDLLERETRPLFEAWKSGLDRELAQRFGVAVSELRPWHYRDRFFQLPPPEGDQAELDPVLEGKDIVALAIRSFDDLGFDIRPIVERSDLFPGDPETSRKCQHAFCLSVDAPRDVRVLCNITTDQRWMGTTLHEFGHGIYGSSLDPGLPFVLRDDPHTLCNEAIALLMERHLLDAGWLERVLGLDSGAARAFATSGRRRLAIRHLVFTRWVLVMCHFERALYEDPDRDDLGVLWWDLVERFQQVRRPVAGPSRRRLGGQDPLRGPPGLLPELPDRRGVRRAARARGRARVRRRVPGQPRRRRLPARAHVPARRHPVVARSHRVALGPAARPVVLSRDASAWRAA